MGAGGRMQYVAYPRSYFFDFHLILTLQALHIVGSK